MWLRGAHAAPILPNVNYSIIEEPIFTENSSLMKHPCHLPWMFCGFVGRKDRTGCSYRRYLNSQIKLSFCQLPTHRFHVQWNVGFSRNLEAGEPFAGNLRAKGWGRRTTESYLTLHPLPPSFWPMQYLCSWYWPLALGGWLSIGSKRQTLTASVGTVALILLSELPGNGKHNLTHLVF